MKHYVVNETFGSVQGEGHRAGTPMVFLRFSRCNLRCDDRPGSQEPSDNLVEQSQRAGFLCDTEFESGRRLSLKQTVDAVLDAAGRGQRFYSWALLTGGEPALQADGALRDALHKAGFQIAIETNGTRQLCGGLDWICVSPKTAEHTIQQLRAHEVKYVRRHGQGIPQPRCQAEHHFLSPAFQSDGTILRRDLEWCLELVQKHAGWRLSTQDHKFWQVR